MRTGDGSRSMGGVACIVAALLVGLLFLAGSPARTQGSAPHEPAAAEPAPPPAAPPGQPAAQRGKRDACRFEAQRQHLRGSDRLDQLELCVAQARVDCLEEAIANKVPNSERRAAMQRCLGD